MERRRDQGFDQGVEGKPNKWVSLRAELAKRGSKEHELLCLQDASDQHDVHSEQDVQNQNDVQNVKQEALAFQASPLPPVRLFNYCIYSFDPEFSEDDFKQFAAEFVRVAWEHNLMVGEPIEMETYELEKLEDCFFSAVDAEAQFVLVFTEGRDALFHQKIKQLGTKHEICTQELRSRHATRAAGIREAKKSSIMATVVKNAREKLIKRFGEKVLEKSYTELLAPICEADGQAALDYKNCNRYLFRQLLVAEQERMLHDELEKDEAERLAEVVASHEEEDEGVVSDYAEEDEGVVADDEVGDEQKESVLVINFGRVKFLEM
ncbi:unnamed protein product [Bursaphelenchus okinawaensis]|uniref:Uncharacterized protein n=1 Tax=Bursaphelenchus okinawaensis TaxID=465554 RepID=A0A811JRG3_9BILA|nr:unnamed protein product [Bursaphelenchus okinawaensis]CAG9079869.1 unnamed protein product [Bursaphelenchus okinawaensis]